MDRYYCPYSLFYGFVTVSPNNEHTIGPRGAVKKREREEQIVLPLFNGQILKEPQVFVIKTSNK